MCSHNICRVPSSWWLEFRRQWPGNVAVHGNQSGKVLTKGVKCCNFFIWASRFLCRWILGPQVQQTTAHWGAADSLLFIILQVCTLSAWECFWVMHLLTGPVKWRQDYLIREQIQFFVLVRGVNRVVLNLTCVGVSSFPSSTIIKKHLNFDLNNPQDIRSNCFQIFPVIISVRLCDSVFSSSTG